MKKEYFTATINNNIYGNCFWSAQLKISEIDSFFLFDFKTKQSFETFFLVCLYKKKILVSQSSKKKKTILIKFPYHRRHLFLIKVNKIPKIPLSLSRVFIICVYKYIYISQKTQNKTKKKKDYRYICDHEL